MSTTGSRRAVLVVEDSVAVRNMLEDFLGLYGYDVLVASHPDTAFKRLKQSGAELDAMILDIGLDDNRSGIEVLELMRLDERFVDLPVIVLTGMLLTPQEEQTRSAGTARSCSTNAKGTSVSSITLPASSARCGAPQRVAKRQRRTVKSGYPSRPHRHHCCPPLRRTVRLQPCVRATTRRGTPTPVLTERVRLGSFVEPPARPVS